VSVVAALVAGVAAGAAMWALLRPTFAAPLFIRTNVRGAEVPTAAGVIVPLATLVVAAVAGVATAAGVDLDDGAHRLTSGVLVAVAGFGLLGLLDDLAGAGESGGFRGHLRAAAGGRLTTGGLKLAGGAAVALAAVRAAEPAEGVGRLVLDAALVALAANLGNLFDRAPGRALKATAVSFAAVAVVSGLSDSLVPVAVAVGTGLGLLVPDLRERCMLGDAGANALGGAVGLGVVVTAGDGGRVGVLVALAALNVASEVVSFTRVIERVPPLRALDRAGRLPSTRDGEAPR
jgi:UDP-N-acetylmuramyl pentapeptide phosphotransferase/UDP-N-acetylglucosamine-1-phosphate transferase